MTFDVIFGYENHYFIPNYTLLFMRKWCLQMKKRLTITLDVGFDVVPGIDHHQRINSGTNGIQLYK